MSNQLNINNKNKVMKEERIQKLVTDWTVNPRWKGIERPYTAEEVVNLQGSYKIEHSIAKMGAEKLWKKLTRIIHSVNKSKNQYI
ncbi:MAG: hypothetical protein L3J20_10340 [Flavobacteriaceae bacterium]|nr:hypothetical protein [Flavobacteriaceae bacterium]